MTDSNPKDDIALLANTPALQHCLELGAGVIDLYVNTNNVLPRRMSRLHFKGWSFDMSNRLRISAAVSHLLKVISIRT